MRAKRFALPKAACGRYGFLKPVKRGRYLPVYFLKEKTLGLATLCGGGGVSMACALEMIG